MVWRRILVSRRYLLRCDATRVRSQVIAELTYDNNCDDGYVRP